MRWKASVAKNSYVLHPYDDGEKLRKLLFGILAQLERLTIAHGG
jgi:hypothetical protein